jgi:hypothetical protein
MPKTVQPYDKTGLKKMLPPLTRPPTLVHTMMEGAFASCDNEMCRLVLEQFQEQKLQAVLPMEATYLSLFKLKTVAKRCEELYVAG